MELWDKEEFFTIMGKHNQLDNYIYDVAERFRKLKGHKNDGYYDSWEIDNFGEGTCILVTSIIDSHCSCCSDDHDSVAIPYELFYSEQAWKDFEERIKKEKEEKLLKEKRSKAAKKAAATRKKKAQYKKLKKEFEGE